jgi:hypothetical protein
MKTFRVQKENEMRPKTIFYSAFLLFMVSAFSFSGCSKLFGPSDADVIKAINESGAFKDLTMQSPIVVLKKDGPNTDGSWTVKIKVIISYEIQNKQMSAPVEKTPVYTLVKSKDNTGQTVWKVKI